jgi:Xaa-Pro aminopeptidase
MDFHRLQDVAVEGIAKLLVSLGICSSAKVHIAYSRFYPHAIGHWLGMDTHDTDK